MIKKALDGVKVVDFGWVLVSPLTVKMLADYGATVVSVESTSRPDLLRVGTPYKNGIPGVDRAGYFAYGAANKYSISIDLRHPKGMDVAKRLVSWADIVSENRRAGVMAKMGLSYGELTKVNSNVILVSSSNQGQTGPYSSHPGLGIHLNGLAGFDNFIGWPCEEWITLLIAYTDYLTPPLAVAAVVAALEHRQETGEGQFLDISQLEVGLQFLIPPILDYSINGVEPAKAGNSCQYAAPHGIYRCKGDDRWCAIAVFSDAEWEAFCEAIDNTTYIYDSRFSTLMLRKENEEELNRLVEGWTINHDATEVMRKMQEIGVAAGVVQNAKDLYNDRQLRDRDYFWMLDHKELGKFTHLGQPSIMSETPAKPYMAAPCLGEHTEYVCKELLGMSENEFDEILISGALGY